MGTLEKIKNKKGVVKAVIYARFSSDNQRDESIDAQIRAIKDYADKNDIIIIGEYIDKAKSAMTDNRPEFLRMVDDSAERNFDAVIVHKLDRFARNRGDSIGYRMQLKRHGVSLISVLEYLDEDSPESVILESVLEAMAEYYSLNLAREVRKGLTENALKGIHTGGKPPLGYDVDPDSRKLIINEHEAQAVKIIFQRITEGVGYTGIIRELNEKGYRTKVGNRFGKNSIHSLLTNEKYTGTYIFNKSAAKDVDGKRNSHSFKDDSEIIRLENFIPAIISKDTYLTVQHLMKTRKHIPETYKGQEVYLLTGKIVCGICGCSYVGNRKRDGRNKALQIRYGCNRRHRQTKIACDNKEIRREYIEAFVLEKLSEQIFNDSLIPQVTEYYNQYIKSTNSNNDIQLTNLKKQGKELNRQISNIISVISDTASSALVSKLSTLEDELREINAQIEYLSNNITGMLKEDDIAKAFMLARELISNHTLPSLKKLIRMFVDKVVMHTDHAEVYFNFSNNKNLPQPSSGNDKVTVNFVEPTSSYHDDDLKKVVSDAVT